MTITEQHDTSTRAVAQKLGVLEALHHEIGQQLAKARAEAGPVLRRAAVLDGATAIAIDVPGYGPVGKVNIKAGEVRTVIDPEALELLAMECDGMTEVIDPAALDRPDVQAYIRMAHPELVGHEVSDVFRAHVSGHLSGDGEYVVERTGEAVKVAAVTRYGPTGAFAFSWTKPTKAEPGGKRLVAQAWREARAAAGQTGEVWELPGDDRDTMSP